MSEPLVTVVIPIYNVEKYLERCMNSVISQTYKNLEIILVDDGSVDACPAICDRLAKTDDRILVVHKENAGLGMARNTGLNIATGKYIFFFDSDDYVDETIVEKCVKNAEENNSDAVIYGRYDVYEDGYIAKKVICVDNKIYLGDAITNDLLPSMFTYNMGFGVSVWGKMFKVSTIRNAEIHFFSERELISEDAYFALEFFSFASVVTILEENLYYYFKRSSSLSRVFRNDRQQQNNVFLEKSLDYINERGLSNKVAAHIKARYHMFSLAAMKQVVRAPMKDNEKKEELRKILKDEILRRNLSREVLRLHKGGMKLFFFLLRLRCICLCEIMLRHRYKKI